MAYSAKFASAFYGPFREAAESAPQFGDRRSYQMDPPNGDEAMREIALDLEEGADIVMVKPALAYLDLIYRVKHEFNVPVAAYNVSGEYSMIRAAGINGWLDEERATMEVLTSIQARRRGLILTYFATAVAKHLRLDSSMHAESHGDDFDQTCRESSRLAGRIALRSRGASRAARASDDRPVRRRDSDVRGRARIRRAHGIAARNPLRLRRDASGIAECPIRREKPLHRPGTQLMQLAQCTRDKDRNRAPAGRVDSASSKQRGAKRDPRPIDRMHDDADDAGTRQAGEFPSSMKLSFGPSPMNG